ncbi:hypothetical protein CJ030_MR0G007782 [Morella rubra]|uniref:Pentatricopeptide repeat-containing protein n=1 Tax=Morella rubra TaxID=262757 RepID=A0A6A1UKB5_9ROSI|nr:hypothetical protein CJ030_MR0G007782 [Morella rubra]
MCFDRLLRLFGDTRCIPSGRAVHGKIITSGFLPDVYANNQLLSLYVKVNRLDDDRKVFDAMPERNLVSWTALVSGYSKMDIVLKGRDICF